jgi:hypothetical protein
MENNGVGEACRACGGGEVYTGFWWEILRERIYLGDADIDGSIILRWIFRKWDVGVWTGLSWLRIGTGAALVSLVMKLRVP